MYLTIYSSRSSTPSNDLQNLRLASCSNLLRSPSSSTTSGSSFMSPMPPPSMPLSHSFQTPKRGKIELSKISQRIVQKLPKKSLQKSSPKCRHLLCHFLIHSFQKPKRGTKKLFWVRKIHIYFSMSFFWVFGNCTLTKKKSLSRLLFDFTETF